MMDEYAELCADHVALKTKNYALLRTVLELEWDRDRLRSVCKLAGAAIKAIHEGAGGCWVTKQLDTEPGDGEVICPGCHVLAEIELVLPGEKAPEELDTE